MNLDTSTLFGSFAKLTAVTSILLLTPVPSAAQDADHRSIVLDILLITATDSADDLGLPVDRSTEIGVLHSSPEEILSLVESLDRQRRVTIVSAPRITTIDGRLANLSTTRKDRSTRIKILPTLLESERIDLDIEISSSTSTSAAREPLFEQLQTVVDNGATTYLEAESQIGEQGETYRLLITTSIVSSDLRL